MTPRAEGPPENTRPAGLVVLHPCEGTVKQLNQLGNQMQLTISAHQGNVLTLLTSENITIQPHTPPQNLQ